MRSTGPANQGLVVDFSAFETASDALTFSNMEKEAGQYTETVINHASNTVKRNVRAQTPRGRTGKLAQGIKQKTSGKGTRRVGIVKTTGRVAHLVAGGVAAHRIESAKIMPIHGPNLSSAIVAFAYAAEHKGFSANPFFERGVKQSSQEIQSIVDKASQTMVHDLARRVEGKR